MKKTITLLFLSLCSFMTFAQITIVSADMPAPGWVNAQHKDTLTGAVNFGNRGANQVYDFSSFSNNVLDTTFYLTPTSTQTSSIPGATLAITNDHSTYIFAKNAATLFDFVGGQVVYSGTTLLTPFSPVDTGYKFTTAYGNHFAGTYGFTTTQPGSAFGQPSIYQVRITNTTTYTDTIDGWGKVKTPAGTYNCLRQHRVEHSSTLLEYQLFSISPWANVPTSSSLPANPIVSTTNNYNYLAKETHGTVITFGYDANGAPTTASWSTTPPVPVAKFGETNGAHGLVAFHDSSTGAPLTYSWNYGDGSALGTTQNPNHVYAANGTYYVCLTVTNTSGTNTWCDSVHITNITVAVRPGAANDTASVIQPGTANINVLANDTNYNAGDSLCITAVLGAQSGWATIQGCSHIVFHALDSNYTGLDTFYYKVCDQQQPTLCDTARIIVNVKPHASALPTASFTFSQNGCLGGTFVSHSVSADSLFWHFTALPTGLDTTIIGSSLIAVPNSASAFSGHNFSVCLTAKNTAGTNQVCDTVSFICVGVNEIGGQEWKVYPNPAATEIKLDISSMDQSNYTAVQIYDISGQVIKTLSVSSVTSINVSDMSNGIYLMGLLDKNNTRKVLGKFAVVR